MTDVTQPETAQAAFLSPSIHPIAVSNQNKSHIWSVAILVLGLGLSVVWVAFLGWCAFGLFF